MPNWKRTRLFAELDAYTDWEWSCRKQEESDDASDYYIPILIETESCDPESLQTAVRQALGRKDVKGRHCICLPPWYWGKGETGASCYVSALVTPAFFELMERKEDEGNLRRMIRQLVVGQRLEKRAVDHRGGGARSERKPAGRSAGSAAHKAPDQTRGASADSSSDDIVVVATIDDAIGFAHERFRASDGSSRVEYAWVQDHSAPVSHGAGRVPYGREFSKAEIGSLMKEPAHRGDDEALYREAGLIDFTRTGPKPIALRISHGTHVLDLACGENPPADKGGRPIICVQLPATVTQDTSGAGLTPFVFDAIRYVFDRVDEIAARMPGGRPLPVVINFSYGFLAGPHDGTHPLELAIDALVAERRKKAPVAVVLPSGNGHLSQCHAELPLENPGETFTLDWRILPDDQTPTFLEVWLPEGAAESGRQVELSVAPPGLSYSRPLGDDKSGEALAWRAGDDLLCKLSYQFVPASQRGRFMVAIAPTAFPDSRQGFAPFGIWRVRLTNRKLTGKTAHLWIQRDDTPHGYPLRGRQSYFEGGSYRFEDESKQFFHERFDPQGRIVEEDLPGSFIRRAGTISAIASGSVPVVIAGLAGKEGKPAKYSAGGPILRQAGAPKAAPLRPDAAAVSDDSEVHTGVLAAGSQSGSVVEMDGTSVAAPQVARRIADFFAGGSQPTTQAEQAVYARALGEPSDLLKKMTNRPTPSSLRIGAGRIDVQPVVKVRRYET